MNRVLFWQRLGVIVCFVSIFQCVTIPKFFELGIFFCQLHWHCYSFQGPKKSTWLSIFVFPQAILAQVFGLFQTPAINTYGLLTKCEIKMAGVSVHKLAKKELDQYPAILTEQERAW